VEPGDSFKAIWGTGYRKGRAFVEIVHRKEVLQSYWTDGKKTQAKIEQKVSEAMRGGFTFRVTYVRENRAYLTDRQVEVPWTNKDLEVKWERFTSKLEPAVRETWTAVITGPDAKKAVAEMVATLYDESLDAYQPHDWQKTFSNLFRKEYSYFNSRFENSSLNLRTLQGGWKRKHESINWSHPSWHPEMVSPLWGYRGTARLAAGFSGKRGMRPSARNFSAVAPSYNSAPIMTKAMETSKSASLSVRAQAHSLSLGSLDESADFAMDMEGASLSFNSSGGRGTGARSGGIDLSKVSARKNLNETAFFFPKLISDKDGIVRMEFTMPEALTKWKFLGFAHDKEMRSGFLSDSMVTAKDIMVQPNPPRFLREGDKIEFTVKVSNQSPTIQKGTGPPDLSMIPEPTKVWTGNSAIK
jgi:hypothetical protein